MRRRGELVFQLELWQIVLLGRLLLNLLALADFRCVNVSRSDWTAAFVPGSSLCRLTGAQHFRNRGCVMRVTRRMRTKANLMHQTISICIMYPNMLSAYSIVQPCCLIISFCVYLFKAEQWGHLCLWLMMCVRYELNDVSAAETSQSAGSRIKTITRSHNTEKLLSLLWFRAFLNDFIISTFLFMFLKTLFVAMISVPWLFLVSDWTKRLRWRRSVQRKDGRVCDRWQRSRVKPERIPADLTRWQHGWLRVMCSLTPTVGQQPHWGGGNTWTPPSSPPTPVPLKDRRRKMRWARKMTHRKPASLSLQFQLCDKTYKTYMVIFKMARCRVRLNILFLFYIKPLFNLVIPIEITIK